MAKGRNRRPAHMSRRSFLRASLSGLGGMFALSKGAFLSSGCSNRGGDPTPQTSPNLVFVFADELRQHAVGCYNADPVITPNLDRLASEGLVVENCVSNRPICSPARAMLFTGRYPHSNGVLGNCHSGNLVYDNYLREADRCLSDVLRDAGYSQGYIGKLHLDCPAVENYPHVGYGETTGTIWDAYTPPGQRRHGFDFWYSYGCYDEHFDPHYWVNDAPVTERVEPGEYSVKHETDVAIEYIRNVDGQYRDSNKPFSLFVSYNPPHMPFGQVPQEYVDMYGGQTYLDLLNRPNVLLEGDGANAETHVKNYFAAVTAVDDNVGRIMQALKDEGLEDDTIVVFTSDHGELMGSHGLMTKVWWYEESLMVPFIIRWPNRINPGRDDLLLSTPDIPPTLLGLMGCGGMIPFQVEGSDYSEIFLGGDTSRPTSALYLKVWPDNPAGGMRGVRTHQYTYVTGGGDTYLYDNENDPYQMANIAAASPGVVAQLDAEMREWLQNTNDPWLTG